MISLTEASTVPSLSSMKAQFKTISTPDGPMSLYVAIPEGQNERAPAQAIIVLQEAFGVNHHIQSICHRLADAGYMAVSPELFHRSGAGIQFGYDDFKLILPIFGTLTNPMMMTDLNASYEYLKTEFNLGSEQISMIGFCMGGFAAVLAACQLPFRKVVSCYGGGMVHLRSGIAFTPVVNSFGELKAPLLLIFGGKDSSIPPSDIELIEANLQSHQKPYQCVIYPDGGHGFMCDERASYHQPSSDAAWKKIMSWLAG